MISQEVLAAIGALSGLIGTVTVALWRIFKQVRKFVEEQEKIQDCVATIKKEVTPNSGSSMKDTINGLKIAIDRIDVRQQVIDQRTKATLHYNTEFALFEVDRSGRIVWNNDAFKKLTDDNGRMDGTDWFAIVEENFRPAFIEEINSCLRMGRKIDIDTVSQKGKFIHFSGYPYKVDENNHEGFLIHLYYGERS